MLLISKTYWLGMPFWYRGNLPDGTTVEPVETWLSQRPRVVERVDQTIHDFRASTTVDLAMLAVTSRQLRSLVES